MAYTREERYEVIWNSLRSIQKHALANATRGPFAKVDVSWRELKVHEQEALLRLDFEFMLGQKFPQ